MANEKTLNLFVSSPGDVQSERERVDFVVARLNAEFAGRVQIRTIRWETRFYSSHETFQTQIPEAAACDLVLAVFGARLGSPLPERFRPMPSGEPYPSGTAYEVLTAIEARRKGEGVPDVYVFRRPSAPLVALDARDRAEIENQWRRLTEFFETWFRNRSGEFLAAFQEFSTTDEFAAKIEDCLRQWLARRGFAAKGAVWDRTRLGSPFPGLAPFDEARQSVFFGRALVIDQAIARLRALEGPANASFLLLIGASGSGKSSLLRAGLAPRLVQPGVFPEVDLWRRAVMVPGADPFASLAECLLAPEALQRELASSPFRAKDLLAKQLAGDPDIAVAPLRDALDRAAAARQREEGFEAPRLARLLLGVDQAERLLIETDPAVATRFSALIAALARQRLASVVMVLRSDAYARFQAIEALVRLRDAGATLDLLAPTASELEDMTTGPAALCDPPLDFEQKDGRSLAARLVRDARGGDALPLLQMTLSRLSAAEAGRGDGALRFADYRGMDEAVTETANEALSGLDAPARAQLPNLIAGLVRDVAADPLTGAPTPVIGALDRTRFETGRPERRALVEAFVAKRLLTAEGDGARPIARPTHEALLRIWPEAVAIIAEAAHLIRTRHALEPIAREWAEAPVADKARHLDISPALLDGAQRYVERFGDEASAATRAFVAAASVAAEARRDRERLEQERRLADARAIAAANQRIARRTGAGLIVALALAGLAGWQWLAADAAKKDAQAQRDRAEHTLALATETADGLVFDLAQKFRGVIGVPKPIVLDILQRARGLQEQLLKGGESTAKLQANHAAALAETAVTLLALGDSNGALALARQSRDLFVDAVVRAPGDMRPLHDLALTNRTIGDILRRQGDLAGAEAAYKQAQATVGQAPAELRSNPRILGDQAGVFEGLGEIDVARGDLPAALEAFRNDLAIAKPLADADPKSIQTRNGLAVAQRHIGDVLLKQKDLDGAAAAFDAASVVAEALARENPDDTTLQRDFSVGKERLGETLTAKHDIAGALKAYADGEAMAFAMAARDPSNLDWQYDLAIGDNEVGGAKLTLGDLPGALTAYADAVRIDRFLTTRDRANEEWRANLWANLLGLGDAQAKHAENAAALATYRDALGVAKAAADGAPANSDWPGDAVYADNKIGDALAATGDAAGALVAYNDGLTAIRALASAKPDAIDRMGDLDVSLTKVAGARALLSDVAGALAAYHEAAAIERRLIAADPKAARRGELSVVLVTSGHLALRQGDVDEALADFRESAKLTETLSVEDAANTLWPSERTVALDGLGDALLRKSDAPGALDAYRSSLAIDDARSAAEPPNRATRAERAREHETISDIERRRNDLAGALADIRAAIALRKDLADEASDDRGDRRAQMVDDNRLGVALMAQNDVAGAAAAYGDSATIARAFAAQADATTDVRYDLAISLNGLGWALLHGKDAVGAAQALAEALSLARGLARGDPSRAQYQRQLWLVATNLGDAGLTLGNRAGALAAYDDGRDAAAALVALDKSDPTSASDLHASVDKIGFVANAMVIAGDYDAALAALDKATPVAADQNWLDLVRAAALMLLDRPDEARPLYLKHRGETSFGGKPWETVATSGFAQMRERGVSHPLMDEIGKAFAAGP